MDLESFSKLKGSFSSSDGSFLQLYGRPTRSTSAPCATLTNQGFDSRGGKKVASEKPQEATVRVRKGLELHLREPTAAGRAG